MAYLDIHPQYRDLSERQGLTAPADFLALPGVICCGHPDRNVARVTLGEGEGADAVPAFLKREHRTHWRDRLANACAGFGLVSKSRREFALLRALESTDIGAPQPIAVGEDEDGRAFLLVRELERCQDLRQFLCEIASASPEARYNFARQFGAALARIHNAGFVHPEMLSKHILIRPTPALVGWTVQVLDWQRGKHCTQVPWRTRWRDLAALDATLADELATPRMRLRALHAYLRSSRNANRGGLENPSDLPISAIGKGQGLARAARAIRRRAVRLLERRRIREMRQPPLELGTQNLVWLDGEALQVTREFQDELGGHVPDWLKKRTRLVTNKNVRPLVQVVHLTPSRIAHLATNLASHPWRWLWARLCGRPMVGSELESMKVLFRLQRYGVTMPRLLAAGQKHLKPWQTQSFLLTEPQTGAVPLVSFLHHADTAMRHRVINQVGRVFRQMHQATCYVEAENRASICELLTVCCHAASGLTVALSSVHGIDKSHYPNPVRGQRDLAALAEALTTLCSRTDLLRGFLAYTGQKHLSPVIKRFALRIMGRLDAGRPQRRVAA